MLPVGICIGVCIGPPSFPQGPPAFPEALPAFPEALPAFLKALLAFPEVLIGLVVVVIVPYVATKLPRKFVYANFQRRILNSRKSVSWSAVPQAPYYFTFLDASSHLYKRVCPLVGRSVSRSVGPSVRDAKGTSPVGQLDAPSVSLIRGFFL